MIIYLYPRHDMQAIAELQRLYGHHVKPLELGGLTRNTVRSVVRAISSMEVTALVVPDDCSRHNEMIEYVKSCAFYIGLPRMSVTRFLQQTKPVAASAVPPTQHPAAAGKPIAPAQAGASPSEAHRTALQH